MSLDLAGTLVTVVTQGPRPSMNLPVCDEDAFLVDTLGDAGVCLDGTRLFWWRSWGDARSLEKFVEFEEVYIHQ